MFDSKYCHLELLRHGHLVVVNNFKITFQIDETMKVCDNGKINVLKSGKILNAKSIITQFHNNNVITIRLSQLAAMDNFEITFQNF
jgi:hypothetical protein